MLIAIYLNDHLTLATAGRELARRTAASNRTSDLGPWLEEVADDLEADRRALLEVMSALEVGVDRVKVASGWFGEKLGRLKPNGRLRTYSPLSRVVELEALTLLTQANLALWRTLERHRRDEPRLGSFPFDELVARAERHLDELAGRRLDATEAAFSPTGAVAPTEHRREPE